MRKPTTSSDRCAGHGAVVKTLAGALALAAVVAASPAAADDARAVPAAPGVAAFGAARPGPTVALPQTRRLAVAVRPPAAPGAVAGDPDIAAWRVEPRSGAGLLIAIMAMLGSCDYRCELFGP